MFSWSSSPLLKKIYQGLEEQQRIIEQLKGYLEERLSPFQRHLAEQRVSADHTLKHLERRLKPLRQYVQGETTNLERVMTHLEAGLRDQFETFEELLASQRDLLEQANRYIEEQPQPFLKYLEDGRRAIEMIYGDLEQRLDAFLQNLAEQGQILDSLREPRLTSQYEASAEYLEERQRALAQYARAGEYRPEELFAQLDAAAERHKPPRQDQNTLFARVFEQARLADQRLREAMGVPDSSTPDHDLAVPDSSIPDRDLAVPDSSTPDRDLAVPDSSTPYRDLFRGQVVSINRADLKDSVNPNQPPELRGEEEQAG